MEIGQIVRGHVNEVLKLNLDISTGRLRICYQCPLYSPKMGGICNNKLWLNIETGDVSSVKKIGYVNGCSCRLLAKTRILNTKCPAGKW